MPTAPIAMAPASERPPMIVSAGYFSSRRAPSFQSSHETALRRAFIRSILQSARVGTWRHAHRAGGCTHSPPDQPVSSRGGEHTVRFGERSATDAREYTLHYKVICVNAAGSAHGSCWRYRDMPAPVFRPTSNADCDIELL